MGLRGVPTDSETPEGDNVGCRATGQEWRGEAELCGMEGRDWKGGLCAPCFMVSGSLTFLVLTLVVVRVEGLGSTPSGLQALHKRAMLGLKQASNS